MRLPQRVWFTVHEVASRWGCSIADVAGWAAMGAFKIVTGVPPTECGDARIAGLVQIEPTDFMPIFRRCGTGPNEAHLKRFRQLEEHDWLHITVPKDGVLVAVEDMIILVEDVLRFEKTNNVFDSGFGSVGSGDDGDYDWAAMNIEITRRVFEDGLPASQSELIRELQDWFAARSQTGLFPDESSIRRRVKPILDALRFKRPNR